MLLERDDDFLTAIIGDEEFIIMIAYFLIFILGAVVGAIGTIMLLLSMGSSKYNNK